MSKIIGCVNCPFCLIRLQGFHETYSSAICIHPKHYKIVKCDVDDFNDVPYEYETGKWIASEVDIGPSTPPKWCPLKKYF